MPTYTHTHTHSRTHAHAHTHTHAASSNRGPLAADLVAVLDQFGVPKSEVVRPCEADGAEEIEKISGGMEDCIGPRAKERSSEDEREPADGGKDAVF